jgi:hypothetical protein
MDLSQLSTEDLKAIQKGDLSSVSSAGLKIIAGAHKPQSYDLDGQGGMVPSNTPEARELQSPTSGMSGPQLFAAGAGKSPVDLARGIGQMVGLESRADVGASRKQDQALIDTGAGKWGNIFGNVGALAPTMLIPGANTYGGAAAINGIAGLLAPSTSTGETAMNTGIGAALGPAGLLVGRLGMGLAKAAKAAIIDPFTKSGQTTIASRALQNFAGTPAEAQAAAARLSNPPATLPGVQPTAAEIANNAGLAQLERQLRNNPEYLTTLTDRNQSNRAAMTGALRKVAGTDADMAAAQAARDKAVAPLYEAAGKASAPLDDEMTALLQRPSMQKAIPRAQALAAEKGDSFGLAPTMQGLPTSLSGKDLQYLKMSLNDLANTGPQNGMGAHEIGAVKGTLGKLNDWIQGNVPELKAADQAFADLSKPINQMSVGSQLSDKLLPALSDFGNNTRLSAATYANAMRNGDQLAANATGWKGSTLEKVMTPEQLDTLTKIGQQLARRSNADELGRSVGSNTGQNLVSQNVLSQLMGPIGLPQGFMSRIGQGALGRTMSLPFTKTIYAAAEPDVMRHLANAALDPQLAAGLLRGPVKGPTPLLLRKIGGKNDGLGFGLLPAGSRSTNSSQQ